MRYQPFRLSLSVSTILFYNNLHALVANPRDEDRAWLGRECCHTICGACRPESCPVESVKIHLLIVVETRDSDKACGSLNGDATLWDAVDTSLTYSTLSVAQVRLSLPSLNAMVGVSHFSVLLNQESWLSRIFSRARSFCMPWLLMQGRRERRIRRLSLQTPLFLCMVLFLHNNIHFSDLRSGGKHIFRYLSQNWELWQRRGWSS